MFAKHSVTSLMACHFSTCTDASKTPPYTVEDAGIRRHDKLANVAWEFLFGIVARVSVGQTVAFVPGLIIDVGIVYTTWLFGPDQWEQVPLIGNNMGCIVFSNTILMTILFWTFIKTFGVNAASSYIGYGDQLLISISSVAQLFSSDNTSGHSLGIW